MSNNSVKITAVLVALVSVISVFAVACSSKDSGQLLFEKGGKLYFRKTADDNAHELLTDSKGVTVVDENGNMIWRITDAAGSEQTVAVSYPAIVNDGSYASCQDFSIRLPRGWTSTSDINFIMENKDKSYEVIYSLFGADDEGNIETAEERVSTIETAYKPSVDSGESVLEKANTQIGGRDAIKITIKSTDKAKSKSYMEGYYISTKYGVMSFVCATKFEDAGKYDFKALLDTIEFRR